jgi:hypothetical protein
MAAGIPAGAVAAAFPAPAVAPGRLRRFVTIAGKVARLSAVRPDLSHRYLLQPVVLLLTLLLTLLLMLLQTLRLHIRSRTTPPQAPHGLPLRRLRASAAAAGPATDKLISNTRAAAAGQVGRHGRRGPRRLGLRRA